MKNRLLVTLGIALVVVLAVLIVSHIKQDRDAPSLKRTVHQRADIHMPTSSPQPQSRSLSAIEDNLIDEQLHAGGRAWALSFSDSTVPDEAKKIISKDLSVIFGHLPVAEIDRLPFPIEGKLNGTKVQLTHRVRLEGGVRKGPKELMDDPFMCLVEGNAETGLYIPKEITDAYQLAIERSRKYSDAYVKLRHLLDALNGLDQHPITNAKELFLLSDDNQSQAAELAQMSDAALASAWGKYKYHEPSLLAITGANGTSLEKYGVLVAQTYSGPNFNEFFPLIYRNGQWRIFVGRGE